MARQSVNRSDHRELFRIRTSTLREHFSVDIQFVREDTADLAGVAIVSAPKEYKFQAAERYLYSFGVRLFSLVRDSLVQLGSIGIQLKVDFEDVLLWSDEDIGSDIVANLVPEAARFRYKPGHPHAGKCVTRSINDISMEEWRQLEEIPYPLRQQKADFYVPVVQKWLSAVCRSSSLVAFRVEEIQQLESKWAEGLRSGLELACGQAQSHVFELATRHYATRLKSHANSAGKLPPKKQNLSVHLDPAKLTPRQYECFPCDSSTV
jgi:hypothetical protein